MATSFVQAKHNSEHAIEERIKPVARVCLESGEGCSEDGSVAASSDAAKSGGQAVAAAPAQAAKSGADVYNGACVVCHAAGVAGAPKQGDKAAWAERIAKGKETLYGSAINGFNGMPPRGTCMSCSDEELKAAVDYMVENSQ
jgi:cytochrome c5